VVRVIPTSAAPGSAAGLGQTVAQAQSGQWIPFAAISPDGRKIYFAAYTQQGLTATGPMTGQIAVVDLVTGRSRAVYTGAAGKPGLITSDPGVQYLLLQIPRKTGQPPRLARLDLSTGKITYLPSGWLGLIGTPLTW
jgi:hypothetical protein